MKATAEKLLYTAFLSLCLIVTGCGGGGGGSDATADTTCSIEDEKTAVHELMNDVYYWYDEVPDVDPADYATKEELLDVLIQPEKNLNHIYSYLTTVAEEDAFLNNAAYVGFGFSMGFSASGQVFLREVFPGGPAAGAFLVRGDEIVAIEGTPVSSMTDAQFDAAFGPNEEGYQVDFTINPVNGTGERTVTLAKAEVQTPVVGTVKHNLPGGDAMNPADDTTYIFFRSFVNPAFDELDAAFAEMKKQGDTKLILDLRYNGGGLISVAQHLGSLISGIDNADEVIAELEFNDRYTDLNEAYTMETLPNSVDVSELVVITTGNTASASEMIANGLEPFTDDIQVKVVGSRSYGKPVGQSRLDFSLVDENCTEDILRAVTFKVVNANGDGEYYTGLPVDCAAVDDVGHPLGDTNEASLKEALNVLSSGAGCSTASIKAMQAQAKMMSLQPDGDPFIRDGWDLLIGGAK